MFLHSSNTELIIKYLERRLYFHGDLMVKIGLIYKQLTPRDIKVLNSIERGMKRYEYVPLELIEKYSKLPETHIVLILSKLHRLKLVKRKTIAGYKSFRLTYLGLDMLALSTLVRMNVVEAIGDRLAVGKESEIFRALAPGGKQIAVKFMRIGRTSFHMTRRVREWADNPRLDWYKQAKIAAEREYKATKEIYREGGSVPSPIAYNRHAVVTEFIEGIELYRKPEIQDPHAVLVKILDTVRIAYTKAGIVHGDLSEYNVLVDPMNNKPYIIDWPQYVYKEHPQSEELLRRDIEYIIRFFRKQYRVEIDTAKALRYVRGEDEQIE